MRVAVLHTDGFGGQGGIAAYVRNLLTALCSFEKTEEVQALPRYICEAVGPLPSKLHYRLSAANGVFSYLRNVFQLLSSTSSFELVVCAHLHLLPLAYLLSLRNRCPLVLVIYGIDAWEPPRRRIVSFFLRYIDEVWSISNFTLSCFRKWATLGRNTRFRILECAIDLDSFKPAGSNQEQLPERLRLLSITRLSASERYKGIDQVLELVAEDQRLSYVVCGEGDDRARLMQKAKELNISEQVEFLGYVNEEEKLQQLHQADVFVLLSQQEGFGIVFIEALASGVPVVACRRGGAIDALRDGMLGILIEPDNRAELEAAVWQAYHQGPPPRESLEVFSFTHFESQVHTFLNDFCRERRSPEST